MITIPKRQIRASFNNKTIRVYQAYSNEIADTAVSAGTFVSPPFKTDRMTWIKPSFLWMMYRSGWAQKDAGQCRILAIDITISGFEWALKNSCLSHKPPEISAKEWESLKSSKPVRIQWDPERDLDLNPMEHRSIQIGLSNEAVLKYTQGWIQNITDVTDFSLDAFNLVQRGKFEKVKKMLPKETEYSLSLNISNHIGATS